jgi:hypothetical protein
LGFAVDHLGEVVADVDQIMQNTAVIFRVLRPLFSEALCFG